MAAMKYPTKVVLGEIAVRDGLQHEEKTIPTHILQTKEAVRLYNELREKKLVGGLFHATC